MRKCFKYIENNALPAYFTANIKCTTVKNQNGISVEKKYKSCDCLSDLRPYLFWETHSLLLVFPAGLTQKQSICHSYLTHRHTTAFIDETVCLYDASIVVVLCTVLHLVSFCTIISECGERSSGRKSQWNFISRELVLMLEADLFAGCVCVSWVLKRRQLCLHKVKRTRWNTGPCLCVCTHFK